MDTPGKKLLGRAVDRTLDYVDAKNSVRDKTSPEVKIALRQLQTTYRSAKERGDELPSIWDTGFRVFSEYDEDGVLLFLLSVVGAPTHRFVDVGAGDGIHASNCANLAFNLGFDGVLVDADASSVARGRNLYSRHPDTRRYPPRFVEAFVTVANINEILERARVVGEVDLFSIDIDGNDYWIWEALEAVRPRIVIIETHVEYGLADTVAPYQEDFVWRRAPPGSPIGASPAAMTRLAETMGYQLVGADRLGFNAVYVRAELADGALPALEVDDLFRHDRNHAFTGA